jgi:hypothetical protein
LSSWPEYRQHFSGGRVNKRPDQQADFTKERKRRKSLKLIL